MPFLSEVIGRERLKEQLFQIQKDERIKVILFYGNEGVGKHYIAQAFARSLLCQSAQIDGQAGACHACSACRLWQTNQHPDCTDLQVEDRERIIKADCLREKVLADIHYTPRLGKRRVFIIDADALNEVGQNVLLKTLEEIPPYAYILLTVTRLEQLLVTVRSRCLPLYVEPLSITDLNQVLTKELGERWKCPEGEIDEDLLPCLYTVGGGSPGQAKQFLSSGAFAESKEFLRPLKDAFCGRHELDFFVKLGSLLANKDRLDLYLSLLVHLLALIAQLQADKKDKYFAGRHTEILQVPAWQALLEIAEEVCALKNPTPERLINITKYISEAKEALVMNVNYDLAIHRLLLKIGKEMTHA